MEALDDLGDQTSDLKLVKYLLLGVLRVNDLIKFEILRLTTAPFSCVLPRSTLPLFNPTQKKRK